MGFIYHLQKTLNEAGFQSELIYWTSEERYRRLAKSNRLQKVWLRIQMYVLYPFLIVLKGLTGKGNAVFIVTSGTFYAPYLTKFFFRFKKTRVIHLLYDLFPDAIEVAGGIKPGSLSSHLCGEVTKKNLIKLDGTVYLGKFLKEHAEFRWAKPTHAAIIDISTDLTLYPTTFQPSEISGKIIVHYGGQLGHMHDAHSIIESIKFVLDSELNTKVAFNFYVSGAQANFIEQELKNYPVTIKAAIPTSTWIEDIQHFHLGLVSLSPGGATVCLPSKTYSMMAGGLAILGICPQWSDLAGLIENLDAGWVINNSPHQSIADLKRGSYLERIRTTRDIDSVRQSFKNTLVEILANPQVLRQKRLNAFNGIRANYNNSSLSKKWDEFITELG